MIPPIFFKKSETPPRGFTLVELLCVLVVLVVLISLVMPSLMKQQEKAKATLCVAQLRNIAVVMSSFRAERGNRMWNLNPASSGGEGGLSPMQVFYKMGLMRSGLELRCPSAPDDRKGAWKSGGSGDSAYMANVANSFVSYVVNGSGFYQFSPWKTSIFVSNFSYYHEVESKLPVFMDGLAFQLNLTSWRHPERFNRIALRHGERANVLFLDGHVESLNHHSLERLDPTAGLNTAWTAEFGVQ